MKKLLWAVVIFIGLAIIGIITQQEEQKKSNKVITRYNNATQSEKNCVETLGQGVYKDKPLEWKLDNCNVPK